VIIGCRVHSAARSSTQVPPPPLREEITKTDKEVMLLDRLADHVRAPLEASCQRNAPE